MQNPVLHNTAANPPSDEIDLRELILMLWGNRRLIIITTLAALMIAAAYAFFSTPVYETQAQALPPPTSGLASYNKAYQMSGPAVAGISNQDQLLDVIPLLTTDAAYELFLRHIASASLRQQFFDQHYLPGIQGSGTISEAGRSNLWNQFNTSLTITLPRKAEDNNLVRLSMQGQQPSLITEWLNSYLMMAISAAQEELARNLASAVLQRQDSLQEQINTLRDNARTQRNYEIARLEEALALAESIDLQQPPDTGNLITSYSGATTYMRGAHTLRNELQLLRERVNDDPFIEQLPAIFKRQELLKNIDLDPTHITVATIDKAARAPDSPIKPRKALILALGLVLGGMLGIVIALVRNMLKN